MHEETGRAGQNPFLIIKCSSDSSLISEGDRKCHQISQYYPSACQKNLGRR